MSTVAPKLRLWPRYAISPEGDRTRVDCASDVPAGWALETPLPGTPPEPDIAAVRAEYRAALGKAPFNGWDIAALKAKMAEAAAIELETE